MRRSRSVIDFNQEKNRTRPFGEMRFSIQSEKLV
jgi:hypothetical protein